jgi:hypothetical protein
MFARNLNLNDMKKAIGIGVLMLTCLTVFESCKKTEDNDIAASETTVAVALKANQSYTYTLPATVGKQTYKITQSSSHSATAAITSDASGNMQLVYIPALNYIGSDAIALTTARDGSCQGNRPPHHKPKGEHHSKLKLPLPHKHHKKNKATENNILINFNISNDETITTVN